MLHEWTRLTFLHWPYPVQALERLVPPQLHIETFEGRAWVGLVPFLMRVRGSRTPSVPWLSSFPETNVRTYVRGPDGRSGIWFLSLDAARLAPVLAARSRYHLPYKWSRMHVTQSPAQIRYECQRLWPGPRWAASVIEVAPGPLLHPGDLGELDHFLTARYRLYSRSRRGIATVAAQHDPWQLYRARATMLRDDLVRAAGLPPPESEPLVHFSPGVEVRIGRSERVAASAQS
jgi:uncharacterized protein